MKPHLKEMEKRLDAVEESSKRKCDHIARMEK
jgi:hypothetical protein